MTRKGYKVGKEGYHPPQSGPGVELGGESEKKVTTSTTRKGAKSRGRQLVQNRIQQRGGRVAHAGEERERCWGPRKEGKGRSKR